MKKDCDVSVILVNYNGKRYIDNLMRSLCQLKHSDFTYEVIFVDNASTDGSVQYLKEKQLEQVIDLTIVESEENLGFAGGNNLGVEYASGSYIVFLNNDTMPETDWLENLYHYINRSPDVVMANSKLVFFYDFIKLTFRTQDKILLKHEIQINGKEYKIENKFCKNLLYEPDRLVCFGHSEICVPLLDGETDYIILLETISAGEGDRALACEEEAGLVSNETAQLSISCGDIAQERFTLIQNAGSGINEDYDGFDIGFCELDGEAYAKEYEITNGCGASIIMRRDDFTQCGMFDEKFFMYYEDTDLSFRMKKNGGKIMYCPDSVVRHIHTGSSTEWSPFFVYHIYRNKLLFLKKNFGGKVFWKYFWSQLKNGIKERNKSKIKGTLDSLGL